MATPLATQLKYLQGEAALLNHSVHGLTRWSSHAQCPLGTLAMLARIDLGRLLAGTRHAHCLPPSAAAIAQRRDFEKHLRVDGCARLLSVLRATIGFPQRRPRIVSMREAPAATPQTRSMHADRTLMALHHVVNGHPSAPDLVDGSVLRIDLRGVSAEISCDAIVAHAGGRLHVVEVSASNATDSRPTRETRGAALDRAATYATLLRDAVQRLEGPPAVVSSEAVIITPAGGHGADASKVDVTRRLARFRKCRETMPAIEDQLARLPADLTFTPVADESSSEEQRLEALRRIIDQIGTAYSPTCLATCGAALLCRTHANPTPAV